jgi:WD40 repeat protein
MSSAPGGRPELVAVTNGEETVKLLDLDSGAYAQNIGGDLGSVIDAQWSPTNPYLLATASTDRTARMFDVRRAGPGACLCVYDSYKTLALPLQLINRSSARGGGADPPLRTTPSALLHMGMAWERADDASAFAVRKRLARRAALSSSSHQVASHRGGLVRVRFTPDGGHLVTGSSDRVLRTWDTLTGHLLCSLTGNITVDTARMFEISNDSSAIISSASVGINAHNLVNGRLLLSLRGHFGRITVLCTHPWREEVYSASKDGEILCWAPEGGRPRDVISA